MPSESPSRPGVEGVNNAIVSAFCCERRDSVSFTFIPCLSVSVITHTHSHTLDDVHTHTDTHALTHTQRRPHTHTDTHTRSRAVSSSEGSERLIFTTQIFWETIITLLTNLVECAVVTETRLCSSLWRFYPWEPYLRLEQETCFTACLSAPAPHTHTHTHAHHTHNTHTYSHTPHAQAHTQNTHTHAHTHPLT